MRESKLSKRQIIGICRGRVRYYGWIELSQALRSSPRCCQRKRKRSWLSVSEPIWGKDLCAECSANLAVRGSGTGECGDRGRAVANDVTQSFGGASIEVVVTEYRLPNATACRISRLLRSAYFNATVD